MGFEFDSSDLSTSKKLKAEHINDAVESIETFVNQGIGRKELKSASITDDPLNPYEKEGFVDSNLIYRPEFYGSPSPRMMAVSGQTHFRESPYSWPDAALFSHEISGDSWTGISNMCARIKLRHKATVNIMCSYYAFEFGGVNWARTSTSSNKPSTGWPQTNHGYESLPAADMRLMVDGNPYSTTQRTVFTSLVEAKRELFTDFPIGSLQGRLYRHVQNGFMFFPLIGRKLMSNVLQVRLDEGVHDVGLVMRLRARRDLFPGSVHESHVGPTFVKSELHLIEDEDLPEFPRRKHIFVMSRNFIVDCYYDDNEPL